MSTIDANTLKVIYEMATVKKSSGNSLVDVVINPINDIAYLICNNIIFYFEDKDDTDYENYVYFDFKQLPGHDFTRAAINTETSKIYLVDAAKDVLIYDISDIENYTIDYAAATQYEIWTDIAVNKNTDKIFLAAEEVTLIQRVDGITTQNDYDFGFDMDLGDLTAIDIDSTLNKLYIGQEESGGPYESDLIIMDLDDVLGDDDEDVEDGDVAFAKHVTTLAVPIVKEIKIDSARNLLYMTTQEDTLFRIIDTTTDTVIGTVDIGVSGAGIAFDSANNRIFVGGEDGAIHVIQAESISTQTPTVTKKSGGSDQEWKSKPTFGKHFLTNVQLVECGFMFESKCFMITDNWHTPFDKIKMLTGFPYDFELNTYAQNGIKRIEIAFVPEVGAKHKAEVLFEFHFNYDKTLENIVVKQNENLVDTKILNATLTNDPENLGMYNIKIDNVKFLEQPHFEVIAINAVDFKGRSTVTYLNEGIDVVGGSYNKPPTEQILSEEKYGGLQTITRIDKFTGIWENEQGIKYTKNDYNTWKRITPYTFERINDSPTDVMTRTHSGFDELKEDEKQRAIQYVYITYPKLFVEATFAEIDNIFAYDFPTEETDRLANTDLQ